MIRNTRDNDSLDQFRRRVLDYLDAILRAIEVKQEQASSDDSRPKRRPHFRTKRAAGWMQLTLDDVLKKRQRGGP